MTHHFILGDEINPCLSIADRMPQAVSAFDHQIFFDPKYPTKYFPGICDILPDKPRIVDRDGPIDYKTSRSIDNTGVEIFGIRIIHIPDILKVRYVK